MPLAAELLHEIPKAQALQALRGVVLVAEEVREGGGGCGQVPQNDGLALGARQERTQSRSAALGRGRSRSTSTSTPDAVPLLSVTIHRPSNCDRHE